MFKIGDLVQVKSFVGLFGGAKGIVVKNCTNVSVIVKFDVNGSSSLNNRRVEMSVAELIKITVDKSIIQSCIDNDIRAILLDVRTLYGKNLTMPPGWKIVDFAEVKNGDFYLDVLTGKVKLAENVKWTFIRLIVEEAPHSIYNRNPYMDQD